MAEEVLLPELLAIIFGIVRNQGSIIDRVRLRCVCRRLHAADWELTSPEWLSRHPDLDRFNPSVRRLWTLAAAKLMNNCFRACPTRILWRPRELDPHYPGRGFILESFVGQTQESRTFRWGIYIGIPKDGSTILDARCSFRRQWAVMRPGSTVLGAPHQRPEEGKKKKPNRRNVKKRQKRRREETD